MTDHNKSFLLILKLLGFKYGLNSKIHSALALYQYHGKGQIEEPELTDK